VLRAHLRAGLGINSGHHAAEVLVWPRADAERGRVAGILWNVVGLRRPKPCVIRRAPFEITRRPDAMWEVRGARILSGSRTHPAKQGDEDEPAYPAARHAT